MLFDNAERLYTHSVRSMTVIYTTYTNIRSFAVGKDVEDSCNITVFVRYNDSAESEKCIRPLTVIMCNMQHSRPGN